MDDVPPETSGLRLSHDPGNHQIGGDALVDKVADHAHQSQIGPNVLLPTRAMPSARSLSRPRSWKLIEDQGADRFQKGIVVQQAQQDARSHDDDARSRPAFLVESGPDSRCRGLARCRVRETCASPPLGPPSAAVRGQRCAPALGQPRIENRRRHARGLCRPGRSLQDDRRMRAQGGEQFGENFVDG